METVKTKTANRLKAIRGLVKHKLSENMVCAEKLPLAKCREILNTGEKQHSDEEIIIIRDYLYQLAAIASEQLDFEEQQKEQEERQEKEQQAKVISLNEHKNSNYEKSDYLRTG